MSRKLLRTSEKLGGALERIADNLEAVAAETQRLENIYQRKLAGLEELKKSLLHQAFTGELT